MPNTYVPIETVTTGSAVPSVSFNVSGISNYTDLRLVINGTTTVTGYAFTLGVNGDTGSNYSQTFMSGNGSIAQSGRYVNSTNASMYLGGWVNGYDSAVLSNILVDLMSYSNTTVNKSIIWRSNSSTRNVEAGTILWRNNAAITSIVISAQAGSNIAAGSTFNLYGIANANQGAAKATGGFITEDSQYWYHIFGATGSFIPNQALTADILVVAGGGAGGSSPGGGANAAGGGAGGLRNITTQSLSNGVTYTCTVGGGGAAAGSTLTGLRGGTGTNSSFVGSGFTTITASGGGGGGAQSNTQGVNLNIQQGGTGGSGGGSGFDGNGNNPAAGAAGNTGGYTPVEGFAGGAGGTPTLYLMGGGGGAGGVGINTGTPGSGGIGPSNSGGPGIAYSNGVTYAKGGDAQSNTGPGTTNTGNGGSGWGNGNSGGSGVVIVRYAK